MLNMRAEGWEALTNKRYHVEVRVKRPEKLCTFHTPSMQVLKISKQDTHLEASSKKGKTLPLPLHAHSCTEERKTVLLGLAII